MLSSSFTLSSRATLLLFVLAKSKGARASCHTDIYGFEHCTSVGSTLIGIIIGILCFFIILGVLGGFRRRNRNQQNLAEIGRMQASGNNGNSYSPPAGPPPPAAYPQPDYIPPYTPPMYSPAYEPPSGTPPTQIKYAPPSGPPPDHPDYQKEQQGSAFPTSGGPSIAPYNLTDLPQYPAPTYSQNNA